MEDLIREGRLFASRSVKDEIKDNPNAKGKTLAQWCREQKRFYIEDSEKIQLIVSRLMACLKKLPCKPGKGISGADPFVIAHAENIGPQCLVVSAERPSNGSEYKPNIPYFCNCRGIKHINFFELMKTEGWKLH